MKATATLTLIENGMTKTVDVPATGTLLQALAALEHPVPHACSGKGTCGKCRVRVSEAAPGTLPKPDARERQLLGDKALAAGFRVACLVPPGDGLTVMLPENAGPARIAVDSSRLGMDAEVARHPLFMREIVDLPIPTLKDQRSLLRRLRDAAGPVLEAALPAVLAQLPAVFAVDRMATDDKDASGAVPCEVTRFSGRIIDVRVPASEPFYGIAVDLGTTTVVAYLCDLATGRAATAAARLNAQKRHGADVISRIQHGMEQKKGRDELRGLIRDDIRALVDELDGHAARAIVFTGNTTMLHLLAGLDPARIAAAPYIPVAVEQLVLPAAEFGTVPGRYAPAVLLPGLAAYVGADTLSAVVATGMHRSAASSLLVDLGTNGEIALGCRNGIAACATAAGPAFEGAGIRHGMGAVDGAIDKVKIVDGRLELSVIGRRKARGLCGTGLVDAVAVLLGCGVIDGTGRIVFLEDAPDGLSEDLASRLVEDDDGRMAFVLVPAAQAHDGLDIVLTQRDVREFQNAKAAVCAGIRILMAHAGVRSEDVKSVWLAGGFGNWMDADSALATGIIPRELAGRIVPVGNAAGLGARLCLCDARRMREQVRLSTRMVYVELSGSKAFNDAYVDAMMFGNEEL